MKYCTKCSTEYLDHISTCADCGSALVGPAEWDGFCRAREQEDAEEFVPVQTLHDSFAADVIRDALETEGIPVLVRSFSDTSFDGIYIPQKGWGLILVPEVFRDRAQQIITFLEQSLPPQSDL
jgi:hypothetical protein